MESNDSPEIPDRGETSDIPGLPSGVVLEEIVTYMKEEIKEWYEYECMNKIYC